MGRTSEFTREEIETEHRRLACLVLKHHNNHLMMESNQVKRRFEEMGFEEGVEISQKHDDPNVTVYKRKRHSADTMEIENHHWRLACFVLKQHNNELMMECGQLKRKYEVGFKGGVEISRKHDDPSVLIYKRKKCCTDVLEDEQRDNRCQECVKLNREIDDLKLMKKRDAVEIEDLRIKCMEMDIEVTALSNHEIDLEKELVAYKIKCQGLSADLQRKGTELENLAVINGGLDRQCEEYRTKCIGMEEKIKGLMEEEIVMSGIVMSERETSARERIRHLEEVIKQMETNERGTFAELEAYRIKCQGLSAELERKGLELENLRVVNGGLDRERQDYRSKCIGLQEQIKGLTEEGIGMSQREKSARERICYLEERFAELETLLLEMQEENEVSSERTCMDMDARDNAADEAHFTRTERSPNSTFTPTCKPSSRQVNSAGVHVSGDSPHANNQRMTDNAFGHQVSFETEGTLTRFHKCSGKPSSENLALQLKQQGARPLTRGKN